MIEKKTVINKIEIERDGVIQIRIGLLLIEDGTEINAKWLRTTLAPTNDPDVVLGQVSVFLADQNYPAIESDDVVRLMAVASTVNTDSVVQRYTSARALVADN